MCKERVSLGAYVDPALHRFGRVTAQLRNMLMALEHRPDSIHHHATMVMYSRNVSGAQEQQESSTLPRL
jgi:hypothetical protein